MDKVKEYSDKDAFARHCGVDVLDIGVYLEGAVFAKLVHHAHRCVVDFDGL